MQDDWRVGGGLTVNAGLRYDVYRQLHRAERPRRQLLSAGRGRATLGVEPGFQVPANAPFFQPDFTPLSIGLVVDPGTRRRPQPDPPGQVRLDACKGDYNNVAPRVGFAWQPTFAPKIVVRGGWGVYYERTGASYKRDLQLSAPFFFYQNVPAPPDMADPYPRLNVNPFQIPLNVQIARRRQRRAALGARRRHAVPRVRAVQRQEQHVHRSAAPHAVPAAVDGRICSTKCSRGVLVDVGYVGSRGVGLLGKVNLAVPLDPRVTPVNGFTDIYDRLGRLINPDFFVPAEFLGLNRNARIPAADQRRPLHLPQPADQECARGWAATSIDQRRLHVQPIDGHAVVRRRAGRARSHGVPRTTSAPRTSTGPTA